MSGSIMKYLVIVLSHNDIQVLKPVNTLIDAQATAIDLANEFFSNDGVAKFFNGSKIETITHINEYYTSSTYHDFEDSVNVVIEEVPL
ncbi:hypothetical protein [Candidatus Sulfurimonas baltica]|uniref:Uncharacterized protein n=1 Tax=Candidatus Sulfurimonas baltica TaxID=2740404 RepID=A0A7S7RMC8_9BACT|nr:hypothetical protein [Candidatus Sulfurimonas baltica]QOY51356.1 hypothetical protein HUE88_09515 [Candidatus Sulfurimonas baltica]